MAIIYILLQRDDCRTIINITLIANYFIRSGKIRISLKRINGGLVCYTLTLSTKLIALINTLTLTLKPNLNNIRINLNKLILRYTITAKCLRYSTLYVLDYTRLYKSKNN